MERDSYDIRPLNELSPLNQNMLLWFDIYAVFPWTDPTAFFSFFASRNNYRTCYIKVLAPSGTRVQAISYVADENHYYYGTSQNMYGVREDCATDGAVCLEVRPPGSPRTHGRDYVNQDESMTRIHVRTLDYAYVVSDVATTLWQSDNTQADIVTDFSQASQTFEVRRKRICYYN